MNKEMNQGTTPTSHKATLGAEKNKKTVKQLNWLSAANKALVMMIVVCGVGYLVGMNDLSIKHFVVQENKREVRLLKDQNTELETKIMALSSYNTINKKIAALGMVKVDRMNYITVNSVVAKK